MIPKFRAWNGERIVKVLTIGWTDGEIDWIDTSKVSGPVEDFILMQYTGLKDKNGVEIYEGDIIKLIGTYKDSKGKELGRYKVKWNDYYTGFYPLIDDHLRGNIEWEVIGNIYENPKLLKEQNK